MQTAHLGLQSLDFSLVFLQRPSLALYLLCSFRDLRGNIINDLTILIICRLVFGSELFQVLFPGLDMAPEGIHESVFVQHSLNSYVAAIKKDSISKTLRSYYI